MSINEDRCNTIIIAFTVSITTAVVVNLLYSIIDDDNIDKKKEINDAEGLESRLGSILEFVRPDEMSTWSQYIWFNLEQFYKKQFGYR